MYANNGDCKLYYETFGDPANATLLLINGLGSQSTNYQDEWCRMFAAEGLQVVRFDNRDVGLSSSFEGAPLNADGAAYTLSDMVADGLITKEEALALANALQEVLLRRPCQCRLRSHRCRLGKNQRRILDRRLAHLFDVAEVVLVLAPRRGAALLGQEGDRALDVAAREIEPGFGF